MARFWRGSSVIVLAMDSLKKGGPMNKLLLATAAVAFAAVGSAGAADLPMKAPPMQTYAPPMSWTGCWISGGIGYGMWNQDHYGELLFPARVQTTDTVTSGGRGWLGRGGVGCDYQINPSFVIGAFGDYDFMSLTSHGRADVAGLGGDEKESASWAAGARLGYLPYPNLMTFVSGGWTQARFDTINLLNTTVNPPVVTGLSMPRTTFNGWFLGGGTEYAVPWTAFHGLFWRTEYRFNTYTAQDIPIIVTATGAPTGTGQHAEKTVQTVTTSLVWKFNWGGPVVAKY
jgi:outer membrane immunogenic protein